ncbi:hypothetical protein L1987_21394 [Smallanthus sonchifolius]|uniref:Uncharacterized protein n=1 Tax=Smallanthus sonchifolius TaxID=185202 RepID=A0ACB9IUZ4_9ASTR|nr:hypothetical protein L1987_21394 [Smallanthus sonchifolius]
MKILLTRRTIPGMKKIPKKRRRRRLQCLSNAKELEAVMKKKIPKCLWKLKLKNHRKRFLKSFPLGRYRFNSFP